MSENLSNIGIIKDILKRHGFSFSKSLGQNFLTNPSVSPKIAEQGGAKQGVGVIEIGAGIGVLTVELAKLASKVVSIEIDKRLLPVLSETLADFSNVKVVNEDVLKVDLERLIADEFNGMDVVVCANLPYYITSPVIMHLLESRLPIKSITVMVQREAAVRLCAKPGSRESGAVTLAVRYFSSPKLLFHVSRGSFMPAPNVDSSVIRLDIFPETSADVLDENTLFRVIRSAFARRRKTLPNALSSGLAAEKAQIIYALNLSDIPQTARAENLSLEDFIRLSNQLITDK